MKIGFAFIPEYSVRHPSGQRPGGSETHSLSRYDIDHRGRALLPLTMVGSDR
jgi:hypothetical protein